jgi:hypothetical protein
MEKVGSNRIFSADQCGTRMARAGKSSQCAALSGFDRRIRSDALTRGVGQETHTIRAQNQLAVDVPGKGLSSPDPNSGKGQRLHVFESGLQKAEK